jgi:hypothetical protein
MSGLLCADGARHSAGFDLLRRSRRARAVGDPKAGPDLDAEADTAPGPESQEGDPRTPAKSKGNESDGFTTAERVAPKECASKMPDPASRAEYARAFGCSATCRSTGADPGGRGPGRVATSAGHDLVLLADAVGDHDPLPHGPGP